MTSPKLRRGGAFGASRSAKDKDDNDLQFSLNPEYDKKDNETAAQAIKHPLIGPVLTQVWFCALYSGDALRNQELTRPAFEGFIERSNFAAKIVHLATTPPPPEEGEGGEGEGAGGGGVNNNSSSKDDAASLTKEASVISAAASGAASLSNSVMAASASATFHPAGDDDDDDENDDDEDNEDEDEIDDDDDDRNNKNAKKRGGGRAAPAAKRRSPSSPPDKEDEIAIKQAKERMLRNAFGEGMDAFDSQRRTRDSLNYNGFIRACIRLTFSWVDAKRRAIKEPPINDMRLAIPERLDYMTRFAQEFGVAYVKETRKAHDLKGLGPDEAYLNSRECDRLLYIYDDVFDRLFQRYKARDQHANRELTMEQNLVLDNYVELDEVREFLKDFGFFPKYISFVEISTCAQCACFGRIMVSPTKQLHNRKSDIQENAAVRQFREQEALKEVGEVSEEEREGVVNPLYLPSLPPEYVKDEPLLDKPRFMSCIVRIAQTLFNRSEFHTELPTVPSRLEELFRVMQGPYERIMGHPMQDDCDYTIPGIPVLSCTNGSASAVTPQEVGITGGDLVTITGTGFGEKRGVFVKFFPPVGEPIILRATEVQRRRTICAAPQVEPGEITMLTEETKEELTVGVKYSARIYVECSNDRLTFSQTDPPQCFYCVRRTKPRQVDPEVHEKLLATFGALCAIGTDVTNTRYMIRNNWRRLKALYRVQERAAVDTERTPDREIYFYQYAARHEGMSELTMDFPGYISTLCRCLYEEFQGKPGWFEKLAQLANISFVPETKLIVNLEAIDNVTRELRYAQQLLISSEWRNLQEVDIFLGPVLCGCVTGRAGPVSSGSSGVKTIHEQHHAMLSYHHYDDVHTERMLLQMAHMAQSFQQFLQRAVLAGFDIAAHHSDPGTRKPFGRCWSLIDEKSRRKLGVAWDYPGWYSSPAKLPAPHCLFNPNATLTFYAGQEAMLKIIGTGTILKDIPGGHPSIQMLYGVLAHKRCSSITHMRSMLQPHGIVFVSKLYNLPK